MQHNSLDRRDFLRIGSAAAVGVAATSVAAGTLKAVQRIDGGNPILAVGFAAAEAGAPVMPAGSLRSNDATLAGSVRVTVHGLWSARTERQQQAVHVSAFFATPAAAQVPFLAWSSARSDAPRVSFTMDLRGRDALPLGIERERLVSAALRRGRFGRMLSSDALPDAALLEQSGALCRLGSSAIPLRRGTYFVALRQAMWDRTPDWRSISFDAEQLRTGGDLVLRGANDTTVGFDYLAISVNPSTV